MVATLTLVYGIAALALGAGVPLVSRLVSWGANRDHDGHFRVLYIIPGFAALMYLLMAVDIGVLSVGTEQILLPRYVDWLVTTPVLVGYAAHVAGAPQKWVRVIAATDALMILFGMVATVASPPLKWLFFAVSGLCHLGLFAVLYRILPTFVEAHAERYGLFKLLQNHVGLLWVAYPLVWIISPSGFGLVGTVGIGLTIAYLDVVAKVPYIYFVWTNRATFGFESGPVDQKSTEKASVAA